ncbi:hypothetical protein QG516_03735 [Pedobacter gandavensis]|uniref:hypothetical protein n=1 Tax=Pedobacter gandavensis TaxID=2679963 RepID=UPI002479D10E|nr:hypothetical protein [Pedobacter gandavensis]WGQ10765.1 hypothetical protein QG516_03735 [Pedobacter gandavensis]
MLNSQNPPDIKVKHISKIEKDDILVNLGSVLEVEEFEKHYCIIISRLDEKQVIKFAKESYMVIM